MSCPTPEEMTEERINRVLTQYRESPKLLWILRSFLGAAAQIHQEVCDLPEKFDLDTAIGDQLTLIGKRVGWPRLHCTCDIQPVFGFACDGFVERQPVAGFCDPNSTWSGCGEFGTGEVTLQDDNLYRAFLKVRVRQFLGLFSTESLEAALVDIWGPTSRLLEARKGRVVVAPGRDLTDTELAVLQLYPRVLPVALGVEVRIHFGSTEVFGFGNGWGGFCDDGGDPILAEDGSLIETEDDEPLEADIQRSQGAPWMCEIDVRPYAC